MTKNLKKSKRRSRIELVFVWVLFILWTYFAYHDLFAKVQLHNEITGTDLQVDVTFAVPLTMITGIFLLSSFFARWEKAAESVLYELYHVCCVLLACFPVPWVIHRFYEDNGPALAAGCCECTLSLFLLCSFCLIPIWLERDREVRS